MPRETVWEVIDQKGTIHSGTEEEMELAFNVMTEQWDNVPFNTSYIEEEKSLYRTKYMFDWTGDLKLVQVHKTS